jgi:hypothetical protein
MTIQEIKKNLIRNPILGKTNKYKNKLLLPYYSAVHHRVLYFTVQSTAAIKPRNTLYWGVPLLSTSYTFWLKYWYFLTMT